MIDIKITEVKQRKICEEYFKSLVDWISANGLWSGLGDSRADDMMQYISGHDRGYILAPAKELKKKSNDFSGVFDAEKILYEATKGKAKWTTSYGLFIKRMRKIYNGFMQEAYNQKMKNGYWLMKELNVQVCPYCNRNYTVTIATSKISVRPEFDHFYPEALHPSLILSFYNYVPSCPQCNHLKKTQELDVNPWIGYEIGKRPYFRVDTSKGDFPAVPKIKVENSNENTKKLGIKELYNEHRDYVKEILDKIQAYNPVTYRAIKKDFQGIVHTEAELEQMVWGNYIQEEDLGKRPFSKLTADILEQYKKYL